MGQIFATLLSNFWKKIKPQIEPIKEKIKEWKKRRAQMKKERERYSIGGLTGSCIFPKIEFSRKNEKQKEKVNFFVFPCKILKSENVV